MSGKNDFFLHPFCLLACLLTIILASSQALPDPLSNKNKGESLEDFDHVLDMFGHGWAWSGIV